MRDAVAGQTWGIEIGLQSQASPFLFKQNPTIASGDWKRSIVTAAGSIGALTNLDNLPTVSPSSSQSVSIILSASETTAAGAGGHINIWGIDAAGAEWSDVEIIVDVVAVSLYSAVPSAAAGANGGLPTVDSSNAVKVQSGTGANQINLSSGTVTLTDGSLTAAKIAADAITAAKIADGAIDAATFAAGAINAAAIATDAITAAKIAPDAIGASELAADAVAEIQSGLATPTNITAGTITTVTNLTNAPTVGDLTATMKASVTTAATAATPAAASVTAPVTVGTNNDKTGYVLSSAGVQAIWDALTSALTTVGSIGKLVVTNLDAAISSRMATFSYTTPPTAVQNRQEMDSNSTQLAKLGTPAGASVSADIAALLVQILAILDDTGTTGVVLSAATKQAIADEILKRGMANVDDASPEELSLYHLIAAILNGSMASGVWTAHKSTGATFIASTLTTDAAAVPVTGVST